MIGKKELLEGRAILNTNFKINDKPAGDMLSDGQVEIFNAIVFKINPRVACLGPTGYGKSEVIALGVIIRACVFGDPFVLASVKYGTSGIIMKKVIDHLFDQKYFIADLQIEKETELDRLRRERKKTSLTFKHGGSIKVVSLHGSDEDASKAIGEHEPNIVLDESPLLTQAKYLQVLKILEGTGNYDDTFLFELGNAVNRNHFMKNVKTNPNYHKIVISLEQALAEGRLNEKSVEEKRGLPFFEQFYLNKFPDEAEMDERGYRNLLTEEEIEAAFIDDIGPYQKKNDKGEIIDQEKLGSDIGGGGDFNAFTVRGERYAFIDRENKSSDTMVNVPEIEDIMSIRKIKAEEVYIDDIGIGRGVSDRMIEKKHNINPVSVGAKSTEPDKYGNLKAECYWKVRTWIKGGGKLKRDERFKQLAWIKYKINSDKVLQIEPKEDLKKRTGKSPDFAESLMLTFAPSGPNPQAFML